MDNTEKHGLNYCSVRSVCMSLKDFGGHIFTADFISSFKIICQKIFNQHLFSLGIHFRVEDISRNFPQFFLWSYYVHELIWLQRVGLISKYLRNTLRAKLQWKEEKNATYKNSC